MKGECLPVFGKIATELLLKIITSQISSVVLNLAPNTFHYAETITRDLAFPYSEILSVKFCKSAESI